MLISIEGLDGVGKSTVSNFLSTELNIPIIEKPIKKLLFLDDEQSKKITHKIYDSYSSNLQAMYYLIGYLSVLEDAQKKDILMDRGFLSTYYFSHNEVTAPLFDMFVNNYGLPDITIVLYASVEERIKRIKERNISDVINNENLSIEETTTLVSNLLNLILEKKDNFSILENIFSIENISSVSQFSFQQITELISNQIHSNVLNNKTKVLKRRSDNNETNNY